MRNQQGAALLVVVMIMTVASSFLLLKAIRPNSIRRDKSTTAALAQAKEALLAWSVSRGGSSGLQRPGELPCPDTNAPGTPDYGTETRPCAAGAIGRLPWKTLGVEELKDAYGETLWYAVDGAFRPRSENDTPINSDTAASMQVYDLDGATLLTPSGFEAVAVIFSPGGVLGAQVRGTAAEQITAANYLDNTGPPVIATARNNGVANGPFIQGGAQGADGNTVINDRLLILTAPELMRVVEKRVATELKALLVNYFSLNGYYPYPAKYDDLNCLDVGAAGSISICNNDTTQCRGRVPDAAIPAPAWFSYNLWGQLIYYAIGTDFLASAPADCSATITVNGTSGTSGLFIMPGTPRGAIVRNAPSQSTGLADYLEDGANQDGWTLSPPEADNYVTPTAASNDRMQILP